MVYDIIARAGQYEALSPNLARGLRYLTETDFSQLADGRHEVDGDRIFVLLQSYETRTENPTPESHRAYIDIQYLIQGEELVGVAPLEEMTQVVEEHPQRDMWLHHGPTETLSLGNGTFLVLWPGDAHAPCIATDGGPAPVRKCVVKIHV